MWLRLRRWLLFSTPLSLPSRFDRAKLTKRAHFAGSSKQDLFTKTELYLDWRRSLELRRWNFSMYLHFTASIDWNGFLFSSSLRSCSATPPRLLLSQAPRTSQSTGIPSRNFRSFDENGSHSRRRFERALSSGRNSLPSIVWRCRMY